MFMLIFSIFLTKVSFFWNVLHSFRDAQFFTRSSYDPKSSSMKKYEVSAFKRTINRIHSPSSSEDIFIAMPKTPIVATFGERFHLKKRGADCYLVGGVKTMSNKKWLRRRTVVIQSALDSPDLGQASKYPEHCHNTFRNNSSGPWSQNLHKKRVKICQNDRIFWHFLTLHFGKIN